MTATVPTDTEEGLRRVERMKKMEAAKIAPLALFLASDAASEVNGQVFGVRANEVYLFSQPEMARSIHSERGWNATTLGERIVAAWKPAFSSNIGGAGAWDPM